MHHSGTRRSKVGGCCQKVAGDSSHDWDSMIPIPSNLKESKEEFENETLTVYDYGAAGGL